GLDIKVLHERQPLFVQLSSGAIQNKYELKILNKTHDTMSVTIATEGLDGVELVGADEPFLARPGKVTPYTVYLRMPRRALESSSMPVYFTLVGVEQPELSAKYKSMFLGPR
ncbi:MAG: cytochrome c oxidase accessory protein CcoG, partial [Gammaproteobacteria bacterium]|nr:cytochrome c oxidase accessory protein CcoG [Gammaproteobacteria bacterium]